MIHILLLILKVIGIILAAILGIVVLLLCMILFVPVRYEIDGQCKGSVDSLKARAKITWLFHLFRADYLYKDGSWRRRIRFAWVKMGGGGRKDAEEKSCEVKKNDEAEKSDTVKINAVVKEESDERKEEEPEKTEKILEDEKAVSQESQESRQESGEGEKEHQEGVEEIPRQESGTGKAAEEPEKQKSASEKGQRIYEKIEAFIQKIKSTFRQICDKFRELSRKKDKLLEFLQDEVHVQAYRRVKRELFRLLKKLRPGKLEVNLLYGFEDPYRTGQVLAGLSILYPVFGPALNVTPDFEKRVLKGSLHIKGRISAVSFLILLWNLWWNKNVRVTYKHIKNFEL